MFQSELLNNGVVLMFYGMGVVFVFLTLLYLSTAMMSYLVRKYFSVSTSGARPTAGQPATDILEHVSVITAAVNHYRQKRRY